MKKFRFVYRFLDTYLSPKRKDYQQNQMREVEYMSMTPQEYENLSKRYSPNTKSWRTIPMAWLFGGGICCFGQALGDLYRYLGVQKELVPALISISLVAIAALLTGFGVFDDIAKYGRAGCLVPITGFSNAVTAPALEFKSEGLILGTGAKLFTLAGPVLAYGIGVSVIYGLIYWVLQMP